MPSTIKAKAVAGAVVQVVAEGQVEGQVEAMDAVVHEAMDEVVAKKKAKIMARVPPTLNLVTIAVMLYTILMFVPQQKLLVFTVRRRAIMPESVTCMRWR